eukprot:981628-Pelagomonas_calceolata.AAC.1
MQAKNSVIGNGNEQKPSAEKLELYEFCLCGKYEQGSYGYLNARSLRRTCPVPRIEPGNAFFPALAGT